MNGAAVEAPLDSSRPRHRVMTVLLVAGITAVMAIWLDWRIIWSNGGLLLRGAINSWFLAICAILAGSLIGTLFATLRVYAPVPLRVAAATVVETLRATPQLIVILWVYFVLPELTRIALSPELSALIALTLIATAYLAEVIRAGILSVPQIQNETGYATGLSARQIFMAITLPQALRNMVPALIATFVTIFKTTTLVYVIGVTEFFHAATIINSRELAPYTIYALIAAYYFVCCYLLSAFIRWIDPKYALQS